MKLLCKCGNVEDIKTDKPIERYEFKACDDTTLILVCKNCSEVVFLKLKNSQWSSEGMPLELYFYVVLSMYFFK